MGLRACAGVELEAPPALAVDVSSEARELVELGAAMGVGVDDVSAAVLHANGDWQAAMLVPPPPPPFSFLRVDRGADQAHAATMPMDVLPQRRGGGGLAVGVATGRIARGWLPPSSAPRFSRAFVTRSSRVGRRWIEMNRVTVGPFLQR
jgi:hypothetical protein